MARITYKEMTARNVALEKAVSENDLDTLTSITSDDGFDVNDVDDQGYSLLHHAAYSSIELLSYVLKLEGVNLYAVNDHGESVLHKACDKEHVQAIIDAGYDGSRCPKAEGRTFESILEQHGITQTEEDSTSPLQEAVAAPNMGDEVDLSGVPATADAE